MTISRKLWLWVLFGVLSIGIHMLGLIKEKVEAELKDETPVDDDE